MVCGLALTLLGWASIAHSEQPANQPANILFIAVDDLNDWIGCLDGHPQARTPNIDRLADSGMLFTNAHCPAPACNPSRTAIMTGISPHRSGLYENGQKMREVLPDAELLPKYLSRHGYWSAGSGKLLHYFIDAPSWDEYFPAKETENPFPRTLYPDERPVSLPRGGPWQYIETDWGGLDATDEEFGGDWLVSEWIGEQLGKQHDQPFFLACGIYRPHEPWFVPQKYFDAFPLNEIRLPPGYREDDLADLPPAGQRRGPNRYFKHIRGEDQWKQAIQGYLASIAFADAMVGRVLDALEKGPNRDNTIVVLWSDHGWHLGEKQHWQKYTAWRVCTRVPLIVRVPKGTTGLPSGTRAGSVCGQPVNLLSLFPTLTELAGVEAKPDNDGPSLVPLLKDPQADWPHVSITHLSEPGSFGLSAEKWRLIQYTNGDQELYDSDSDRYELTNLAGQAKHAPRLAQLRSLAPTEFAPLVPPQEDSLPKLPWQAASDGPAPASKPDGSPFQVVFINRSKQTVKLHWIDRQGQPKLYGSIEPGKRKRQQTRPGAVWLITDQADQPLGHFRVDDRKAQAIIPKAQDLPKSDQAAKRPNVLFIAVDDLNDWVGCLGGHPQAHTPNIDRLAARGTNFTNAHCQAPICGPSRASFLSGRYPFETGLYDQPRGKAKMVDDATHFRGQLMTEYFAQHGYRTLGVGKITHGYPLNQAVQKAGPKGSSGPKPPNEHRFHYTPDPAVPYTGTQTDWGVFPEADDKMPDFQAADWAIEALATHDGKEPFFLAVGFHRPHVPFYVSQPWFDLHPLDKIVLPEIKDDDLDDVPEIGVKVHELPRYPMLPYLRANDNEQLRRCTQAYLACTTFVDSQVGKVIEALKRSPAADNTIIVLFSDHGYHLGEKNRVSKHSLWEESTRVPLIVVEPGQSEGQRCDRPTGLIDLYPTLLELCGLPERAQNSGLSLAPLLRDPEDRSVPWRHSISTTYARGNVSLRSDRYRFIRYVDGSEELYDHQHDPNEWTNLLAKQGAAEKYQAVLQSFRAELPEQQAAYHRSVGTGAVNAWFEAYYKTVPFQGSE